MPIESLKVGDIIYTNCDGWDIAYTYTIDGKHFVIGEVIEIYDSNRMCRIKWMNVIDSFRHTSEYVEVVEREFDLISNEKALALLL